ncbi:hypothetical protein QUF79_09515 [Fictibacillus enclensis]|uniref:hypothetical protein n=1 Tax=Fictibacillus enclensis TaxID=1017270 RepID=UPI0025A06749|nr:hypothetical protein [Fictibacillus enclensis]MDM5198252.1 hypothetical protein [Fictibacillus enclensis]
MKNIAGIIYYSLFFIGLIVTLIIANKGLDTMFSFAFVMGFLLLLFLSCIYFIVKLLLNLKSLTLNQWGRRMLKFLVIASSFSLVYCVLNMVFQCPDPFGISRLGTPVGMAFAMVFWDLMFLKKGEK